jgi:hypothetical protein
VPNLQQEPATNFKAKFTTSVRYGCRIPAIIGVKPDDLVWKGTTLRIDDTACQNRRRGKKQS